MTEGVNRDIIPIVMNRAGITNPPETTVDSNVGA